MLESWSTIQPEHSHQGTAATIVMVAAMTSVPAHEHVRQIIELYRVAVSLRGVVTATPSLLNKWRGIRDGQTRRIFNYCAHGNPW